MAQSLYIKTLIKLILKNFLTIDLIYDDKKNYKNNLIRKCMKKQIIVFVLLLNSINLYSKLWDEKEWIKERTDLEKNYPTIQKSIQDIKEYIMDLIFHNGYLMVPGESFDKMVYETYQLLENRRTTLKDLVAKLTPKNYPKALLYNRSK
jgi:hypothetical protein